MPRSAATPPPVGFPARASSWKQSPTTSGAPRRTYHMRLDPELWARLVQESHRLSLRDGGTLSPSNVLERMLSTLPPLNRSR